MFWEITSICELAACVFGTTKLFQYIGQHQTGQQAKNGQHHQQFDQAEACLCVRGSHCLHSIVMSSQAAVMSLGIAFPTGRTVFSK